MDNQLLTWSFMVSAAVFIDIAAYIFLRHEWKQNGITLTDKFWNIVFDKADQIGNALKKRVAIMVVKYHQDTLAENVTPAASAPDPLPVAGPPVEIVPVLVRTTGKVRHVQFFVDMPLDTQVEVRIGATREAGVTVEKREL